ncbi:MAG: glycoside hydrolase family 3 protein [Flavobacteriaceae bacterium]
MNRLLLLLSLVLILGSCQKKAEKPIIDYKTIWVDSIYSKMTLEEKVGQLFMVAAYSNRDSTHTNSINKMITENHLGGLVFFQGGPVRQAKLTNHFQALSKIPLMISIDAEWGLSMRLDSTPSIPFNMTLGAITDNSIINKLGKQLGRNCKRMGIHVNFAPVVDINTNPKNPIIGVRSFGEDKYNVSKKAIAFTKGMQSEGVLACAKHFPGHGDTATDSHKTLPTVSFDAQRIDSVELYPFKQVFKNGMASVMVAHLNVPSLEPVDGLPSSLSYKITTELLKEKLNYKGLIFTDALNMKGAANFGEPGAIDLLAFKAGNDVLLFSEDAPKAISLIVEAYQKKEISEERLAHSVKKILASKYKVGLNNYQPIELENLVADLNTTADKELYKETIEKAITIIKNENQLLPIAKDSTRNIVLISLGDGDNASFLNALKAEIKTTVLDKSQYQKIKKKALVLISYHRKNARKTNLISNEDTQIIEKISKNHQVIFVDFASLYSASNILFSNIEVAIIAYENSGISQKVTAEIILGMTDAKGKLPASINNEFKTGLGLEFITQHN